MRVVVFCHSLLSDWSHRNAHFLRGVTTELALRGHDVRVYEPRDAWSAMNLVRDHGERALYLSQKAYPFVRSQRYLPDDLVLDEALDRADLVLVNEWNDPGLVARIGQHRRAETSRYRLLFHDTHHRSVTDRSAMCAYDLEGYDGVLAFGEAVRDVYVRQGWSRRAFVWHEAADVRVFRPMIAEPEGELVWIGNWSEGERTRELTELLLEPARDLSLTARAYGVGYPDGALAAFHDHGVAFGGWLPNFRVPEVLASFRMTVNVPRRPHAEMLRGIPTIRVFEALACGIPLLSAPWDDHEKLFTAGADYLVARNGAEMRAHMKMLLADASARRELAFHGRRTIVNRHTTAHRVDELLAIARDLGVRAAPESKEARP